MLRTLTALVLLLGATGCDGGGDPEKPTKTYMGGAVYPDCAALWVAGNTLEPNYDGCATMQSTELAVLVDCADGSQLTTYRDRYWALLGGKVKDSGSDGGISEDAAYSKDYEACKSG